MDKTPLFTSALSSSSSGSFSKIDSNSDIHSDSGSANDDNSNAGIDIAAAKYRLLPPQQILSCLYFCNQVINISLLIYPLYIYLLYIQRPGIFIAPVLLSQGFPESQIGIIMFFSGMIGLVAQVTNFELMSFPMPANPLPSCLLTPFKS